VAGTTQSEATGIQLRLAASGDQEFLLQLYLATQPMETASWNMDATAREQLMRMQFRGRAQTYTAQYPDAEDWILCLNEETDTQVRVGRHLVLRQQDSILGVDLAILPRYQGHGIGSRALREIQRQCAADGLSFRLQVLHTNPAKRLYDRLGFRIVSQDLLFAHMEWSIAWI
jgi:ribosomal protein S18 acetylase RimI-like enzyme